MDFKYVVYQISAILSLLGKSFMCAEPQGPFYPTLAFWGD